MNLRPQIDLPKDYPQPENIIIDCDTGGDDAQCLVLAFSLAKKYNKKIVGIVCVEGNTSIENVIKNVLCCKGILVQNDQKLRNQFPPIIKGSTENLAGHKIYSHLGDDYFHKDGLCSNQQKYLKKANELFNADKQYQQIFNNPESAPEFYSRISKQYSGNLGITAIGPMTNLALAYLYDNEIVNRISCISVMGGQYTGVGMWDYFTADFNLHLDAHAARIIFEVYNNISVVSIQYAFAGKQLDSKAIFENKSTSKAQFVMDIYTPIRAFMNPVLCDPLTIFPMICAKQSSIKGVQASGFIETSGHRTSGFYAQRYPVSETDRTHFFITEMNLEFISKEVIDSYSNSSN